MTPRSAREELLQWATWLTRDRYRAGGFEEVTKARGRKEAFWRIALLFLPLGVFGVLVIWPLLDTFYYSFTDWNGFSRDYRFVGR